MWNRANYTDNSMLFSTTNFSSHLNQQTYLKYKERECLEKDGIAKSCIFIWIWDVFPKIKIRQNLRKKTIKVREVKISSCLNVLVYLRIAQRLICSNQVEMRPFHDAALHQGRCTEDNEETQFLTSPTIHYKRVLQNNLKYGQILIIVFLFTG